MSRSSKKAKLRWVVGLHSCFEAIKTNPLWVDEVVLHENKFGDLAPIEEFCKKQRIKTRFKGTKFFNNLADGHQGVAVSLSDRPRWDDSFADQEISRVVMLDGITDPHNLGAILRTAWLMEVHGVFIPTKRAVDLTPVACKVASGGAEHVPVESVQFQSQISWFKDKGYWIYGLSEKANQQLPQVQFHEKSVIIVGAEGAGLRSSTENFCDQLVSIPQTATGSSYNASVAFALCMYECARSRPFSD